MAAPPELIALVERFRRNLESYKGEQYREARVRQEFIDPFLKLLGWDMENKQGLAERFKEVILEDVLRAGGSIWAPDYCLCMGGTRVFYLEAKKPSVNINEESAPAFQLRRYAWSAKLPLSILTNFEGFAVYDCRVRPFKNDKASTARIMYLTFEEYSARWDEVFSRFSKEAVQSGAFDRYAGAAKSKKGTAAVDDAFLEEIEGWRDAVAHNVALRNPRLSNRDLNFAVQAVIDRLVFLRICEDRGIENYGRLQGLLNGEHVYRRLVELFREADDRYNSGLFHFRAERERPEPDAITTRLDVDDRVLKEILSNLYYPDSPYEFSVLPADILGQVYERFLGKVIHLTEGHHARVEEKPEVRKAGGVYYTPTYIVDYIVRHTVGALLEGKAPNEAAKLRILDPSCGSGSFLIGAYQYLLDWHYDWYIKNDPQRWARGRRPALCKSKAGGWRLTPAERKAILLNNIHGVDIDPQAVEVTKLSLLLKVLEDETGETLNSLRLVYSERALPDLDRNIRCGNSLIGNDFYLGRQNGLFDEEEARERVNAFDWDGKEGFPEIMREGGFDAVIGNPPYIRVRYFRQWCPEEADYLEQRFKCATHVWDVYLLFYEQALRLSRPRGRFGFIVPIQTLHQPNCESLRRLLIEKTAIVDVADLSAMKVFQDAIVKNCILVCINSPSKSSRIRVYQPSLPEHLREPRAWTCSQKSVKANPGFSLKVDLLSPKKSICEKLRKASCELGELCYVTFGLRSCAKGVGKGTKDRLISRNAKLRNARPYLEGREIGRYETQSSGRFIRYLPEEMYSPRTPALFETDKIVSQSMLSKMRLVATLDKGKNYVEQSLVCIIPHGILTAPSPTPCAPLEFLLGVINSTLESFYFGSFVIDFSLGGGLIHATPGSQSRLIVPRTGPEEIDRIVHLVQTMLDLHKKLHAAKNPHDKESLQRLIDATDRQIDQLVYELYGLTEEEIKIVEGGGP